MAAQSLPAPSETVTGSTALGRKLVPPGTAQATVARGRLMDLLSGHVRRYSLILLSGPAGSGKTMLAASWCRAARPSRPVAWLTLDAYDDDPATFWSSAVEALATCGVRFEDLPELVPGEAPAPSLIQRLASALLACPRPVVLVLDDADHLSDSTVAAGLDLLLRRAGSRLRLVLCGRSDPPLPLHRYRLDGTLGEIRGDQLAFTPDETRELLDALGVPVSADAAAALCAEAEGWAVGLRLAAAPLKGGLPPERLITSLAHDDGSVAQYLFKEVLEGQPAGVRRVLARTSVTSELWPDLVDQLTGRPGTRRVLAGLAHANAFVEESPGAPGGFRVHPLFREMLQAELAYEHPGELARLNRSCASYYAAAGRPRTAVAHAVAAEDWASVATLLVDDLLVPRLLVHGTDAGLRGVEAFPADVGGAEAAVVRTVLALVRGWRPAAGDMGATVEAGVSGGRPALRLSATLAALTAAGGTSQPPSLLVPRIDAAVELVSGLPEHDRRARDDAMAVLTSVRAQAALRTEEPMRRLVAAVRASAAAAHTAGARRFRRSSLAELAVLEAVAGRLTRAAQYAAEADAIAAEDGADEVGRDPSAATAMAWVHLRRYELGESRDWLARAQARRGAPAGPGPVGIEALQAVLQSQHLRLRQQHGPAQQVLRPHLEGPRLPRWVAEQVVAEVVHLAIARGHEADGLAMLRDRGRDEPWSRRLVASVALVRGTVADEVEPAEDSAAPLADVVEATVVRACQLLQRGDVTAAADELAAALERARPELLRWPFVDTPPQARRLLRTHPRLREPGAWLNPSSRARPGGVPARTTPAERTEIVQDLSEREMEVLRHLAEMLSTAEIAATMFISVNTVRTHVRSVLRKLGVSRRNQAVRKARERALL
ncbi:helix-turn-helix transcriptional regulator [Blastococcus litoris]|uniref:helix-turn-helix transcriptional regulator n=1 Tax=Blastococcus litoris TaxID=2171622 RepID=UPI000E300DE9|nr:LuxR C-terminal-related transcriptional regulator [Blastococcus litoris]